MNGNQKLGVVLIIAGVFMFIISQTADFYYEDQEKIPNPFGGKAWSMPVTKQNKDLKNGLMYGGLIIGALGGVMILFMKREPEQPKFTGSKAKFCNKCGTKYFEEESESFCVECGNKLNS
ncbi:MAG: hypothetical protein PHE03_12365, partial [Bacteroidales bacterium]|jgi:hypothetical protein|nr:hypothetical protein [Bacteroidales bacterium]